MKKRIDQLLKSCKRLSIDALLVNSQDNVQYLTGMAGGQGYLLISRFGLWYFTHYVYLEEAKKISLWQVVHAQENMAQAIARQAKKSGIRTIGFEAKSLSFLEYKRLKDAITASDVNFVKTSDVVERIRACKSPAELNAIRKAVMITEEALEFAQGLMEGGDISERDLAIQLERFMKLKGDNSVAFSPIVAGDAGAAFPHYVPGPDKLNEKKIVLIDLGAKCCGYCADLTRVFFLGKISGHYIKKIYNIVKGAQDAAIRKIRPGVPAADIDLAARRYIEKKGLGKFFGHGLGHGVGLCVHEAPYISPQSDDILKENMVVTVEPAVYVPGEFGIRLESMVVVKGPKAEVIDGNFYWKHKAR